MTCATRRARIKSSTRYNCLLQFVSRITPQESPRAVDTSPCEVRVLCKALLWLVCF